MEGAQVKIPLVPLHAALRTKGDKDLKALVVKGLEDMAERHQIEAKFIMHLVDDIIEKVREESKKFNPKLPYPPMHANNMSVQIEMPTRGKAGVIEFNTKVDV